MTGRADLSEEQEAVLQDAWDDWVLAQDWRADRVLDEWIDAAVTTGHCTRDGQPARVSKNPAVLLRQLAYAYKIRVAFDYGKDGWTVTVGGSDLRYPDREYTHENQAVALGVATLRHFFPPTRWRDEHGAAALQAYADRPRVPKLATWIPACGEALTDVPYLEHQIHSRLVQMIERIELADGAPNLLSLLEPHPEPPS